MLLADICTALYRPDVVCSSLPPCEVGRAAISIFMKQVQRMSDLSHITPQLPRQRSNRYLLLPTSESLQLLPKLP